MNNEMYFSNSAWKSSWTYEDMDKLPPSLEVEYSFCRSPEIFVLEILFFKSNYQDAREKPFRATMWMQCVSV